MPNSTHRSLAECTVYVEPTRRRMGRVHAHAATLAGWRIQVWPEVWVTRDGRRRDGGVWLADDICLEAEQARILAVDLYKVAAELDAL